MGTEHRAGHRPGRRAGRRGDAAAVEAALVQEIRDELGELVALLSALRPEEWDHPTLCARWTVRDVVGHVIGGYDPKLTVWRAVAGTLRHGLRVDRYIDADARRHAAGRSPEELVAALQAVDLSRGTGAFAPAAHRLRDHLVHQQDIRRPLVRSRPIPEERLVAVLDASYRARGRRPVKVARGLSFSATDLSWTAGSGPLVSGPAESLVLALNRRPAVLPELSGDGLEAVRRRVGSGASNP
jgi:uncharacterized protein (TIGR03083 family)